MYKAERLARSLADELGWEIDEQMDDMICIDLMSDDGDEVLESIHVWINFPTGCDGDLGRAPNVGDIQRLRRTSWESALKELQEIQTTNGSPAPCL